VTEQSAVAMLLALIKQNQIGLEELGNEPGTDGTFPFFSANNGASPVGLFERWQK
jgi:hypothetical protein